MNIELDKLVDIKYSNLRLPAMSIITKGLFKNKAIHLSDEKVWSFTKDGWVSVLVFNPSEELKWDCVSRTTGVWLLYTRAGNSRDLFKRSFIVNYNYNYLIFRYEDKLLLAFIENIPF